MERLAAKANLPMPKLYLIPQPAPNAFATGRNPSHASVAVTQGLLELMNDDELEGVIAHELSHVRNYDILTSSIAATIAGAITWVASMGRWAMIFGGWGGSDNDREGGGLTALLMLIFRAARRNAAAAGHFSPARISGGRFWRQDGRASVRSDQRAPKTRHVQQTNSHGHAAFHRRTLHRGSAEPTPIFRQPFQHASSA